ncbi:MAG: VCBS repeat-containing protein, partial [Lentisphaerae bacterium]|nr:VCBS repeat-containing protein [Lentisphaerota bacterium]
HVPAIAYNFTEILHEKDTGRRFVLDCPNRFAVREVRMEQGEVLLSGRQDLLRDQNGIFAVEGETDPQAGKDWGFHRVSRWDFDGSGKQHLIVGTDRGLLYLLIERRPLGAASRFTMESVGPLRDAAGAVIKIHNRVSAVGFDVDGDGLEDLVVGGGTYQLGINTDPRPGGGIYWLRNRGPDMNGVPVLDPPRPLETGGVALTIRIQDHVQMQAIDLDGDGKPELIIAVQAENFAAHVFRRAASGGLESVRIEIGCFSIHDRLLDLDADGEPEFVFAGGESGVGYYRKLARTVA